MEKCKVTFSNESGQNIVIDFTVDDKDNLDYKPHFEPKLKDPKQELGLMGVLCEIFMQSLHSQGESTDTQN